MVQWHETARVKIGYRRTRIVRGSVDCARSLPEVDDRIEFALVPYVQRTASQISRRSDPVCPELSLDREIPGMPAGCLSIRIHHKVISARIKLRIVILAGDIRSREWISTGIVLPRIIKTANRKSKSDAGSPGRGPVAGVKRSRYHVVTDGVRTAN